MRISAGCRGQALAHPALPFPRTAALALCGTRARHAERSTMSAAEVRNHQPGKTEFVRISADEHDRERALRARFAEFWGTASGEPRTVYDAFISASPLTADVDLEAVDESGVRGWWVRPRQAEPGQAILFLHGGGYVLGSAKAYRGFVSQIVSRAQIPRSSSTIRWLRKPRCRRLRKQPWRPGSGWSRKASTESRLSATRRAAV